MRELKNNSESLLTRFLSVFVLFLLLVSTSTFVSAESGSGSSDNDSEDDSEDESDDELEDETESEDELEDEDESEDEEELEDESEDELDDEDELENEDELEDELDDEEESEDGYSSGPSNPCEKVLYIEKKLFKLNSELLEESEEEDLDEVRKVKSELEQARKNLARAKLECSQGSPVRAAVGKACEVPEDLKQSLEDVKEKYKAAVESKDFEAAKALREEGAKIDMQIKEARLKCASELVPGLMQKTAERCDIPQELYDKLERSQNRLAELEKMGTEVPEDLKEDVSDLEEKIAERKAKCNALKVDSTTDASKVKEYYAQRLSEALDNEDDEAKIKELKELRKEIDETIKNLIESKKKLKYDEVDGLVEKVKFKAKSTSIGDSETTEEVEVEVEVEDSTVTIESGDEEVLLSEGDLEFTADDITVDENGIYVGGVLVKALPSDVFEKNKNLERNAKKIVKMKLEQDGEKIVYKTEYESQRKLLGILKVKAKNKAVVDAETGDLVSEDKPWWNGISSEVEDESESEDDSQETSQTSESASSLSPKLLNPEDSETGVA